MMSRMAEGTCAGCQSVIDEGFVGECWGVATGGSGGGGGDDDAVDDLS